MTGKRAWHSHLKLLDRDRAKIWHTDSYYYIGRKDF